MKPTYLLVLSILLFGCAREIHHSPQEEYLKAHSDIAGEQAQAILNKSITYGLDKAAVRASLGLPKKIFGYMNEGKQMEVWVYSEFEWQPYENILFEDGKVKSWNFPKTVKQELEDRAAKELLTNSAAQETHA